ncbi:Maf family protein, partial [Candidatus Microgenomates bacterium]|nr:Maf family protein [Candidatus Microgenomates bacterium]
KSFIKKIKGSKHTVTGLPLEKLKKNLRSLQIKLD